MEANIQMSTRFKQDSFSFDSLVQYSNLQIIDKPLDIQPENTETACIKSVVNFCKMYSF